MKRKAEIDRDSPLTWSNSPPSERNEVHIPTETIIDHTLDLTEQRTSTSTIKLLIDKMLSDESYIDNVDIKLFQWRKSIQGTYEMINYKEELAEL